MSAPYNPPPGFSPAAQPYGAPTQSYGQPAGYGPPTPPQQPPEAPRYLNPTDVLSAAWGLFKEHAGLLIAMMLVVGLIGAPSSYLPTILMLTRVVAPASVEFFGITLGATLVNLLLFAFLASGMYRITLGLVRRQPLGFGALFAGRAMFKLAALKLLFSIPSLAMFSLQVLGAATETPLLITLAPLLMILILPLVFFWCVYSQASFLVVDKGLGVVAALRESAAITKGNRGNVFVTVLLGALVCVAGAFACGVGMLVTCPIYLMMLPIMYARLTGTDPSQTAMGYGQPPYGLGQPQGYPPAGSYGAPPAGGFGVGPFGGAPGAGPGGPGGSGGPGY
jgi:uncharacterized membrane protein